MRQSVREDYTMYRDRRLNLSIVNLLKAIMIILAIFMLIGFGASQTQVVYAQEDQALPTIYHIYLDDDYVGTIDDQSIVTNYIDERVEQVEQDADDGYTYGLKQELMFIPERVFNNQTNHDQILESLDEVIVIEVKATVLALGDQVVGYFANEDMVEQTLFDYKAKYVDEDILEQLEEQDTDEVELETGETKVLDVSLSEEVSLSGEVVAKDQLLSVEDGVELLEKGTLEELIHEVSEGDTLSSIAAAYDLTTETLLDLNDELDEDSLLQLEQELNVTDYVAFADVIVYEEELVEETISYQTEIEESEELYRGESETKQEGQDGEKEVHYAIERVNGEVSERETINEEIVKEAVDEIIVEGTKVIDSRGTGDFVWPAVGGYISSQYGPRWGSFHSGIDIARPSNRDILATDNGTVEKISYDANGYGHYIVINHNNGYKTLYAHLEQVDVSVGQTVPKGSKIGVMGTTGRSTGVHLHFEVSENGTTINPNHVLN